jgi:hypothetical protein
VSTQSKDGVAGRFDVSHARLWFGLLGGAFAWLAHLMIAYGVAEFGCVGRLGSSTMLGISIVAWLVLVLSGVTFFVAVAAAVAAYRGHRQLVAMQAAQQETSSAAKVYAARAGWITSGLFALVILVESLPVFYYLQDC